MNAQAENQFAFLGPASEAGLADCRRRLEDSPVYHELPARLRFAADLALDELATNTIKYGGNDRAPFEFKLLRGNGRLDIEYADQGAPFDPWEHADGADEATLDSIEDTFIGGRGLIMLKEISSTRHYDRRQDRNFITLTVQEETDEGED